MIRVCISLVVLVIVCITTGCRIHSPEQLDLAKKLLDKYTSSFAETLAITESLGMEEQRLLASYRENYKQIAATEELTLLNAQWSGLQSQVDKLSQNIKTFSTARNDEISRADKELPYFKPVRDNLKATLDKLNETLKAAESAPTLNDRLTFVRNSISDSVNLIKDVQDALNKASAASTQPGFENLQEIVKRLAPLAPKIREYLDGIAKGPTRAPNQQLALAVEATRLARDILSIEVEVVDVEISYHNESRRLSEQALQTTMGTEYLNPLISAIKGRKNSDLESNQKVVETLKNLAAQGDTKEEEIQNILQGLGGYYSARIEIARAQDMLELRRNILTYRHAKLLDLAYDRQRRTLISYGLLTAVRYAEGGWKSEDSAQLMRLIQIGLQAGILTKL